MSIKEYLLQYLLKMKIFNEEVILLCYLNDNDIENEIWSKIRISGKKKNSLKPIVVIGLAKEKDFFEKHRVFDDLNKTGQYLYIESPLTLKKLNNANKEAKSIPDENELNFHILTYSTKYKDNLLIHDLNSILNEDPIDRDKLRKRIRNYKCNSEKEKDKSVNNKITDLFNKVENRGLLKDLIKEIENEC